MCDGGLEQASLINLSRSIRVAARKEKKQRDAVVGPLKPNRV